MKRIAFFYKETCVRQIILPKKPYAIGNSDKCDYFLAELPTNISLVIKTRYNGNFQFLIECCRPIMLGHTKITTGEWWDFPECQQKIWLDDKKHYYFMFSPKNIPFQSSIRARQDLKTRRMSRSEIQMMLLNS